MATAQGAGEIVIAKVCIILSKLDFSLEKIETKLTTRADVQGSRGPEPVQGYVGTAGQLDVRIFCLEV